MTETLAELASARLEFDATPTPRAARHWVNMAWRLYRDGVVEWEAVKAARVGTEAVLGANL